MSGGEGQLEKKGRPLAARKRRILIDLFDIHLHLIPAN